MSLLGKYEILEFLGAGATADVYHARDTVLGREVAIKILKPALVSDAQAFARFVQEARAAASLFHAHIATVLDMSEADGRYFIAMRYISGRPLDKLLAEQGPLPLEEIQLLTRQMGDALDYAHGVGFLHRDVKPSNILRDHQNDYWLTDFGLTRAMMATGLTSHTGAVLGTPSYIPPEIWLGQPATPAADQYALACVIVEALTGKALFTGETPPAIMTRHVMFGAEQLEALNLPPHVRPVLARALAKEPQERYASMADFTQALVSDGQATPPVSVAVTREPPQREQQAAAASQPQNWWNRRLLLVLGLIILALAAVLGFASALSSRQASTAGSNSSRAEQANFTADSRTAEAVASSTAAARSTGDAATQEANRVMVTAALQRTSTARSVQAASTATANARSAQATATVRSVLAAVDPAIADWRLVVQDSFNSDAGRWRTGRYDYGGNSEKATIASGKFRWEYTAKEGVHPTEWLDNLHPSDLYLAVEGNLISGTAEYGLDLSQATDGSYSFSVDSQSGKFRFSYYDYSKGEWTDLIHSTSSPAINTSGTNRLAVLVQGTRLTIFINDQYVDAVTDSRITNGLVGMAVDVSDGDSAIVEFDNFELYQP